MVTKKKKTAIEALVLDKDAVQKLKASLCLDGRVSDEEVRQIAVTLQAFLEMTEPVQQIQLVKKAGAHLEELREEKVDVSLIRPSLHTLALVFVSLQAKNPLRRVCASALNSVASWLQEATVDCLSACLSECLLTPDSDRHPHITDTIAACLDGFPLGERCIQRLLPEVLHFLEKALSGFIQQNSGLIGRHIAQAQLMHLCLTAVKTSMLVLQRSQDATSAALQAVEGSCSLQSSLGSLLDRYVDILTNEEFIQTVQSTAGMASVLLLRSAMGPGEDLATVVCMLLRGSGKGTDAAPCWLRPCLAGLSAEGRPLGISLYLCHGALAMLNWKRATLGPRWEELLLLVPHTLLLLDTSIKESSTAMLVARVLTLWSSAALDCLQVERPSPSPTLYQSLQGGSALHEALLERVYSHWEHPLDGVRHQSRALFKDLIVAHRHASALDPAQPDPYITTLTHGLLGLEWHMRGKYGSLGCLVELLGARHLLAMQPQLPSQLLGLMGDQNMAPYASDLLERLFVSHKGQLAEEEEAGGGGPGGWMELWHQTWVTPLLQVLCRARLDQTTYILDYFLPKLLRCSPSSLTHMVQALQSMGPRGAGPPGSRGAVGALMTCLRAARAQGVAPSLEEGLFGGLVPLSLLRQALVHKHDQVRMDALGLLCETHRRTEGVSPQEMELLRHFLPPNVNCQPPGVRQLTVSLLKRLLCRVKDSSTLLQKRMSQERNQEQRDRDTLTLATYKEFLCWMCETLLEVLVSGASFPSCLTALHLLVLLGQLFSFSTEPDVFAIGSKVTFAHAQNVLYCVASNFLEVKQLASVLLRQLPPSTVGLQDPERLSHVLCAALELSTSTKPYDSVTAAHLLDLLVHQPTLPAALLAYAQAQGLPFQLPLQPASQASEALMLEHNSLAVVLLLLQRLQQEVVSAESSLLQAAASRPLYGRAHCITAVLQRLPLGSLTLTEQWRSVVSKLIAVCYRMSDIVSPVVQSSSPEGLIPMDTDSDASAGLQRILQEIQPRDTNDFFTSARELEPQAGDDPDQHDKTKETKGVCDGGEGYRVTAQMVLVCCWRSMKEVAMMLGELCQSLPLQYNHVDEAHTGLVTEEQVEGVGLYFRQQLLQSRHRGAFELAYVGFVRLTEMLCRSGSQSLQKLPSRWLREVLQEVKSSDPSSKLCATRRSAGIPFYIQALLSSEPKASSCSLLKMTMRELTSLAAPSADQDDKNSTVSQVHALNILRALYRDTRLGENIIPFVSEGMQAAVLGFTSPIWAVRNSSTLLFSTLITRIFGVKKGKDEHSKKNRMTGREFFTRFPALYPFLLSQLQEAAVTVDSASGVVKLHPSLFLLLLVLGRLYPSPMDGSSSPMALAPFMPFIIRCGRSAVYWTREMAARALVPFVLVTQIPATIQTLLQDLPSEPRTKSQQNHIHGTLLQVLFLLHSYQAEAHRPLQTGSGIGHTLRQRMWLASRQNCCVVTRGAYLDVLQCLCGPLAILLPDSEVLELRRETLAVLAASELLGPCGPPTVATASLLSSLGPGAVQYLLSLTRVALSASLQGPWRPLWAGTLLLESVLRGPLYEVRELVLDGLLEKLDEEEVEEQEEEEELAQERRSWLDKSTLFTLSSLALNETHPQCLAKSLRVLCRLSSHGEEIPWRDGDQQLSHIHVLSRLLSLVQSSAHSVELLCDALTLASRLLVQLVTSDPQTLCASDLPTLWGRLVCGCCGDDHPAEVKLAVTEVLVNSTTPLLASPTLPLGLSTTLSLWRSLLTLLQDEDQEVRDSASDFISHVAPHLLHSDVAGVSVSPSVALDQGVGALCALLVVWGQERAGLLTLAEWLLGDEESTRETASEIPSSLDEEDEFLFEKGELNLWAEPVQWARLLHRHLTALTATLGPESRGPGEDRLHTLRIQVQALALDAEQALEALPGPLPQFSCAVEHARLVLRQARATLALDVLERLM
ncbi:thyroid adenoma-associated protein [Gadus macrocephalus]|uniref:thyroid adenoma-associated protein n=1 Tax=Gadus macrocephalus TaxID=80720 RepID=UPI0028CBB498|nr:thyroid adenoma-associated protein [Gadus macrocephalus]